MHLLWTKCADEGGVCECTGHVVYGRKFVSGKPGSGELTGVTQMMAHAYKQKTVSGSVICSASGMGGDPQDGYAKHCLCQSMAGLPAYTCGHTCSHMHAHARTRGRKLFVHALGLAHSSLSIIW